MIKKFNLQIDVTIDSEDEAEFEIIRTNLNLLPEMAETLKLYTEGSMAKMLKASSKLKEVKPRRRRAKKSN